MLVASVAQFGLVRVLPDLGQDHRGVESEEDAERQSHALDADPGRGAEERHLGMERELSFLVLLLKNDYKKYLHWTLVHLLDLERVQHPHCHVAQQQKRYNLNWKRHYWINLVT